MKLETLLLSALTFGPASGYDLKARVETRLQPGRTVSFGAIYPALGKLMAKGWVRPLAGEEGRDVTTRVIELTDTGIQSLQDMVSGLTGEEDPRSEFQLALIMMAWLPDGAVDRLLAERIAALHQIIAPPRRADQGEETPGERVVRRYRVHLARAALSFLQGEGAALIREAKGFR